MSTQDAGPPPGFGIDPETEAMREQLRADLKRDRLEQTELKRLRKENRELKKYLGNHAVVIADALSALDAAMKGPSTVDRGKTIAAVSNTLEYANDCLMHFGLKFDFRKMNKIKKRWDALKASRKSKDSG